MPVVNCHTTACEVYIGRQSGQQHFGNPFGHVRHSAFKIIKMGSREEAIAAYEMWLRGEAFATVEPERRKWIMEQLPTLQGKVLGCWCIPKPCHGEVLERLAAEIGAGA